MPRAKKPSKRLSKNAWERSRDSRAASQKGERRALEEAHALRALHHPNSLHLSSTQPPAAGAHDRDDDEMKRLAYFGVAVTPGDASDAREIAEIEGWDDETLRGNQDCRSPHDQWLISLVRQKKTHDKDK